MVKHKVDWGKKQQAQKNADQRLFGSRSWTLDVYGGEKKADAQIYSLCNKYDEEIAESVIGQIAKHLREEEPRNERRLVMRNDSEARHGKHRIKKFVKKYGGINPNHCHFGNLTVNLHDISNDEREDVLEKLGITKKLEEKRKKLGKAIIFNYIDHEVERSKEEKIEPPESPSPDTSAPDEALAQPELALIGSENAQSGATPPARRTRR